MVKNLPAMQETWVQSLGWEDPLEKGMAAHSFSYFCLENSMDRGAWRTTANGVTRVGHDLIKLRTKSNDLRKRSEEEACLKFSQAEGKLRPP